MMTARGAFVSFRVSQFVRFRKNMVVRFLKELRQFVASN